VGAWYETNKKLIDSYRSGLGLVKNNNQSRVWRNYGRLYRKYYKIAYGNLSNLKSKKNSIMELNIQKNFNKIS
jgi:hypothetical protein